MPSYEFVCADCGPFEVLRSMAQAGSPAQCPECDTQARRVFTAPGVALLAAPRRGALEREERSAHEPEMTTRKTGRHMPHRHGARPAWVMSH
jgi:putative FmdB family regulatory protein